MLVGGRGWLQVFGVVALAVATLLVVRLSWTSVGNRRAAERMPEAELVDESSASPVPAFGRSEPVLVQLEEPDVSFAELETLGVPEPRMQPASRPGRKLLALKNEVQESLTHTAYEHRTRVRPKEGIYEWDCSAMAAWMLRKVAPRARKAMNKKRPVARDFYRRIKRAPTQRAKDGWRRIAHIEEVRPGDMFAWERPAWFASENTGHVGFAIGPAQPDPRWPGAYTLRIVDATSLPHQADTRTDPSGGIGEGTILFMTDGHGKGIGYGWFGTRSRGVVVTDIGFARLSG